MFQRLMTVIVLLNKVSNNLNLSCHVAVRLKISSVYSFDVVMNLRNHFMKIVVWPLEALNTTGKELNFCKVHVFLNKR